MKNFEAFEKGLKDKLNEVEINPPKEAWDNIKGKLEQKRKKRLAFWYRSAGVAAVLLLGLYLAQTGLQNSFKSNESITIEESKDDPDNFNSQQSQDAISNSKQSPALANDDTKIDEKNYDEANAFQQNRSAVSSSKNTQNSPLTKNNASSTTESNLKTAHQFSTTQIKKSKSNQELTILHGVHDTINEKNANDELQLTPITIDQEEAIAEATSDSIPASKKDLVAEAKKIQEEQEEKPKTAKLKRWEIASSISPVYYNSFGNGSSIGEEFANNSKENLTQVSVGINLGYQIDKRWSIRAGFNKLSVGYDTQDIVFSTVSSSSIEIQRHVEFTNASNASFLNIHNKENFEAMRNAMEAEGFVFDELFLNGSLRQTISYFEIPVEARYQLLDRKFGIHLIGGFSSLILDDNELSMVNSNISSEIGRASNLNDWSFTANAGLGFSYGFNASLRLQIEPTLKYQLNPLSDNTGSFKPYIFGLYSGLSYRF